MSTSSRTFRYLFYLCLLCSFFSAEARPTHYRIDLPDQTFFPAKDGANWILEQPESSFPLACILQFDWHPGRAERNILSQAGISLQSYIGGSAWIVYVEAPVDSKLLASVFARWAGALETKHRLHESLASHEVPTWAITSDGTCLYAVHFIRDMQKDEMLRILNDISEEVLAWIEPLNTWYIRARRDVPGRLVTQQQILYVNYISPPLEGTNASVRATMHVNEVNAPPNNLSGAGVVACVFDGGLVDINHPAFGGRASLGEEGAIVEHATHVAGTLGANGSDDTRGMAPEVSILSYALGHFESGSSLYTNPEDIWNNYMAAVVSGGARLITTSLGVNVLANHLPCNLLGDYTLVCALIDSAVRGGLGEEVTILFSAGNENYENAWCEDGYGTLGVPGCAKNTISVGAIDDERALAVFTSWGPADDGRIKPEVVGNGVDVLSTGLDGDYILNSGTSMSTPATAGVVALMLEAWDRHSDLEPPIPAQIKSLLITGAEDLGNIGPDYQFGFGLVNAQNSADIINQYGITRGQVADDENWSQEFTVPADLEELKVSLCWADPPASHLAEATLVNDLDLRLTSPSGTTYLPLTLNPQIPENEAQPQRNSVDVAEQVVVPEPEEGSWTITVQGYDIPIAPQTFGVACNVSLRDNIIQVEGTVTDTETGLPLEGAKICPVDTETCAFTDENGHYSMYYDLDFGHIFLCTALGYQPQRGYLILDTTNQPEECSFEMVAGNMAQVSGTVYDQENAVVEGVIVVVDNDSSLADTTGTNGEFTFLLERGHRYSARTSLEELAAEINFFLPEYGPLPAVDLYLSDAALFVTGPDEYGYRAIQSSDEHRDAPEYSWIEIDPDANGPGTRIDVSLEDQPYEVILPFSFSYYGTTYDTLVVNENGYFCFGSIPEEGGSDLSIHENSRIPSQLGPPAIVAPFWTDFKANRSNLSYWYDEENVRFIIEWYDCRHYLPSSPFETFQVILSNPTPSGDGMILFQYADVNDMGTATVGIESENEVVGLELLFYNEEGEGSTAASIGNIDSGTAILFTHPTVSLSGTVTLHPEDTEVEITARAEEFTTFCDESGDFQLENLPPVLCELKISAPGYETRHLAVDLSAETIDPITVDLWAMLTPRNLTGEYVEDGYNLVWLAPDLPAEEDNTFLNRYRLYRDGEQIQELEANSWTDTGNFEESSLYWVTALYQGGESDTSNHCVPGVSSIEEDGSLPRQFEVSAAWPNPFNPSTNLHIALPEPSSLRVEVFDILGRRVALLMQKEHATAGRIHLNWNAKGHASGLYYLRVEAGQHRIIRKVVLLK